MGPAILPGISPEDLRAAGIRAALASRFAAGGMPAVGATLPTIIDGGALTGPTRRWSPSDSAVFRYFGGEPFKLPINGTDWVKLRTVSYAADGSTGEMIGGSVAFVSDAPRLVLEMVGNGAPYRLWIDGLLSAAVPGVRVYQDASKPLIDWTAISAVPTAHRYRLDFGAGGAASAFAGVTTSVLHDVWRPEPAPLRCVVAGDSFVEGTTADGTPTAIAGLSGLANQMGWRLGLDDVWCSGSGGTGWLRTNGARCNLRDRFARDVIGPAPDIAVVAMGVNDGVEDPVAIRLAVAGCVGAFRAARPDAPLFVVAPWAPQGAGVAAIRDAIKAGAQTDVTGLTLHVETRSPGREWQWPAAGTQGQPTGVGNGDWAIDGFGTHPTVAGHAYLGARLAEAIRAWASGRPG